MMYMGLADAQQYLEKIIITTMARNDTFALMKAAMSPHLDQVDDNLIEIARKVAILQPVLPENLK